MKIDTIRHFGGLINKIPTRIPLSDVILKTIVAINECWKTPVQMSWLISGLSKGDHIQICIQIKVLFFVVLSRGNIVQQRSSSSAVTATTMTEFQTDTTHAATANTAQQNNRVAVRIETDRC